MFYKILKINLAINKKIIIIELLWNINFYSIDGFCHLVITLIYVHVCMDNILVYHYIIIIKIKKNKKGTYHEDEAGIHT